MKETLDRASLPIGQYLTLGELWKRSSFTSELWSTA